MEEQFREFRFQLNRLPSCCITHVPRVSLPREGYSRLACIRDESFLTRAACAREAELKLRALYGAVEQALAKYCNPILPDSFLAVLRTELGKRLLSLKELLGALRTPHTAAVLNRVNACLSPAKVLEEMERFNHTLRTRYALEPFHGCLSRIDYSVSDPSDCVEGPWRLAAPAFRRYGYDLLPAVHALEEDGTRVLEDFQRAFEARAAQEIRTHIIVPAMDRLSILRRLWGRGI